MAIFSENPLSSFTTVQLLINALYWLGLSCLFAIIALGLAGRFTSMTLPYEGPFNGGDLAISTAVITILTLLAL
jgi:hypothetical protein